MSEFIPEGPVRDSDILEAAELTDHIGRIAEDSRRLRLLGRVASVFMGVPLGIQAVLQSDWVLLGQTVFFAGGFLALCEYFSRKFGRTAERMEDWPDEDQVPEYATDTPDRNLTEGEDDGASEALVRSDPTGNLPAPAEDEISLRLADLQDEIDGLKGVRVRQRNWGLGLSVSALAFFASAVAFQEPAGVECGVFLSILAIAPWSFHRLSAKALSRLRTEINLERSLRKYEVRGAQVDVKW